MAGGEVYPNQHTLILNRHTPDAEVKPREDDAPKKADGDELQNFVFREASMAQDYTSQYLMLAREQATNYYHGRLPDVDLEDSDEDRSQAVVTDVRDAVLGIMPDLMRVFFSAGGIVKYDPVIVSDPQRFQENQKQAKLQTQYVREVVLEVDNPDFFMTMHDVFKDAAVRKTGFLRWWWKTNKTPKYTSYTGLPEQLVELLAAEDDVEIISKSADVRADASSMQPIAVYDVTIRRIVKDGHVKIAGVPCENVIVSAGARSADDCSLMGYRDEWDAGEFLAAGLVDDLSELEGCDYDPETRDNPETVARRPGGVSIMGVEDTDPPEDPSRRKITYGDLFVRFDQDGDGIAELLRVQTAGTRYVVLKCEAAEDIDFAAFTCYPEAFEFFGESIADLTMDTQRINSRILRDTLDSLAQSVKPQMGVVEGQVNLDDVLNPDTSNIIRMRAPNMIQPVSIPFVGKEALPVLEIMQQMRQNRTGISDASAGLDPKTFQSTSQQAISNTITKGEGRVELVARMFIESGFKRLFRGISRLIAEHQSTPRVVELSGQMQTIDPKFWDAGMHVKPILALGRGSQQAQLQTLAAIIGKQEQIMQMLGPDNPFVTIEQYYNSLAQSCQVAGLHNVADFFTDPAALVPQQMQSIKAAMLKAMQAKQPPPTGPNPQIEQAKIQSGEKVQAAKLAQKHAGDMASLALEQKKAVMGAMVEIMKAVVSHKGDMNQAAIDGLVTHLGDRLDSLTDLATTKMQIDAQPPQPQPQGL